MEGIFCLMFSGKGLTNEVRTFLYRTACEMYQKSKELVKVRSEHCEGTVRTNFGFAMMGTVGGTKFIADVETEAGKTHTVFIVQDFDLKKALEYGEWIEILPLPEDHPANHAWKN